MKKLKLFLCLTTGLLLIITNSCKKDLVNLNQSANVSGVTTVSQLPADQLIKSKEITDWVSNNAGTKLNPAWDKAMQSVVNGHHTIEVPTSADAALFFTKVNGVLDVYAYKWLDAKPGAKKYTGGVFYYSFQESKAYVLAFVEGKLTSKNVFDLSAAKGQSLSTSKSRSLARIDSKQRVYDDSGVPNLLDWLWCMITGGNWDAGAGCNIYDQNGGGFFGNLLNTMYSIANSLGSVFGDIFGSSDNDGNSTNNSPNTPVNNNNTGVVVVPGDSGSSATIDGSSVISGQSAYISVTVTIPCSPGEVIGGDGTESLQDQSSGAPDPCPNGYTTQVQWVPWNPVSAFAALYNLTSAQEQWLNNNPGYFSAISGYITNDPGLSVNLNDAIDFINFIITYATNNPTDVSLLQNLFMTPNEGLDGPDAFDQSYWDDPNLQIQQQSLPTYQDFHDNFPNIDVDAVYTLIGGTILSHHQSDPADYANACALRVSRALNYSGITIPAVKGTETGADGKNYFLSAQNLNAWMRKTFGAPTDHFTKVQGGTHGENFVGLIAGKKGIYSMIATGWSATGHADLFNGTDCFRGCDITKYTQSIDIWELQ